jgi:hypothetical protein
VPPNPLVPPKPLLVAPVAAAPNGDPVCAAAANGELPFAAAVANGAVVATALAGLENGINVMPTGAPPSCAGCPNPVDLF